MSVIGTPDSTKIQIHPNDTFSSQSTSVVELKGANIEQSYTKNILSFPKPKTKTRYSEGPVTTVIDLLKDSEDYRITGNWNDTTWATVKTNYLDKLITIFKGGGTFYLAYFASSSADCIQVTVKKAVFRIKGGTSHSIEYTIDLLKGQERS